MALREFLRTVIEKVVVKVTKRPVGKRFRYTLESGEVILQKSSDLFGSW